MSPPVAPSATQNGITGTRPKAEIKRETSARIIKAMKAAGMTPRGWQVRSLMGTLLANQEAPTEEQVVRALMSAPWHPKTRRRHWRVGEGGGWAVRS